MEEIAIDFLKKGLACNSMSWKKSILEIRGDYLESRTYTR